MLAKCLQTAKIFSVEHKHLLCTVCKTPCKVVEIAENKNACNACNIYRCKHFLQAFFVCKMFAECKHCKRSAKNDVEQENCLQNICRTFAKILEQVGKNKIV